MDVKYIPADWDRMKSSIGDLIGIGPWGKGIIDDLKKISRNLKDAESDIQRYDRDGIISFSHTNRVSTYQELFEDLKVMHSFTGKVGDIVDRTIDQPFYEDIDAFVSTMQQATISNYTTQNRLGVTEEKTYYAQGMNYTTREAKAELSLDDILSGDNFYSSQMRIEYDMWKGEHPDQDFSYEEYRMAAVNMNAFEYSSIEDQQLNKEFWVSVAAAVVIVGAAVICPPAGLALAATYGTLELSSAVSGKDWLTNRKLGTGERWMRGALAPLDIVPGVSGLKKFGTGVRLSNQVVDMGQMAVKPGLRSTVQREITHVGDMINTAGAMTVQRVKNAGTAVRDASRVARNKVARDLQDVGRLADTAVTSVKNSIPSPSLAAAGDVGSVRMSAENTHFFENKAKRMFSKADSVSVEGVRGSIKEVEHVGTLKGKEVLLKDIYEKEVTYIKRDREEFKHLRNKFNSSVRINFLQDLANDEMKIKSLLSAGLTEVDIKNLKQGLVPDGYQVHHKLPLDDGGTNDFNNLILIKNDPYHKVLTNSQKHLTKGLQVGDSININWPIPDGFIYPTTKK